MDAGGVAEAVGAFASVIFAISHVPMVVKAVRTREVRSYSLPNLLLVNAGNALWTVYVISLPLGPIWALHTLYLLAAATMLALVVAQRRRDRRSGSPDDRAVRSIARRGSMTARGAG